LYYLRKGKEWERLVPAAAEIPGQEQALAKALGNRKVFAKLAKGGSKIDL